MKKVLVWGVGKNAERLINSNINAVIIGIVETYKKNDIFMGFPVFGSENLPPEYDYILVANTHTIEVFYQINDLRININKVIFCKFCPYYNPRENISLIREILGEKYFQYYCNEYKLIDESDFVSDKNLYKSMNTRASFQINEACIWPVIGDKYKEAGSTNNYFWQDLWAAKLIYREKPQVHYDIGSRLDGFIAHLLSFGISVKMIDIRPFPTIIEGLETIVDDATLLHQFENNSIESLSALCSLEHFGLGRYGDPINPEACFICFQSIIKKLKVGGHFYLSVPVGRERVEFNAHRVFYAQTIVDNFSELKLVEFAYTANEKLESGNDLHKYDDDRHDGEYRYGLFHFKK